jgi:hypothetical protein
MEKRLPGAPACNGQGKAHEIGAMIGAQNLASGFRGDDKQGDWNNVNILGLPDLAFDADAGFEFIDPVAVADDDVIAK